MGFGDRIKARREEKDLTLKQLKERSSVAISTLHDYESGTAKRMDALNLIVICKALDVSPMWIMMGKEPPQRNELTQEQQELLKLYDALKDEEREGLKTLLRSVYGSRIVEPPPPKKHN